MNDQELLEAMQADATDQVLLAAIREKLCTELEKPDSELDFDTINVFTKAIDKITGEEQMTETISKQGIQKLKQEIYRQRRYDLIHRTKWIAACVCAIIVISNIWSYAAYGINSFSAAYRMLNGGIVINTDDDSETFIGNPYEEDIRKICLEHDLDVLIPSYLPEDFTPTDLYGDYDEGENHKEIIFYFSQKNAELDLEIIQFVSEDAVVPIGIASDSHNISQQIIGQTVVHIQKEAHQFWAVFQVGSTQYVLYANELDYDECQHILESMFDHS